MRGSYVDAASAQEAQATGKTIKEVALVRTDLPESELDRILDPSGMTE